MLKALAGISRAPFLLLPLTLVAVGSAAALWSGGFSWLRTAVALFGLVALHAAVNAFNEVADYRSGIDLETKRTPFSGGSGTLPSGAASTAVGVGVGVAGTVIGGLVGFWFLSLVGWKLVPILAIGAVATLGYTKILARLYVGEVAAGLGLGAMPVVGVAMIMGVEVGPATITAAVPAFLMTFNLLLLNEFPDEAADRRGGRRNLVLLLGRRRAALLYGVAAVLVPLWLGGAVLRGAVPAAALLALAPSLLLIGPLWWALLAPEKEVPVSALGANVVWILATNSLLAAALVTAAWLQ